MNKPPSPLFLESRSYRRRRLIDAARLLPVAGMIVFLAPALLGTATPGRLASQGLYLFGAWCVLILIAALVSRALRGREQDGEGAP